MDLRRTFPNHCDFGVENSPQLQSLRRVLAAYSWHNPNVGYCQVRMAQLGRQPAKRWQARACVGLGWTDGR